jgi:hypothetical protein
MALGPGSIAFVGFNADGADNLAFAVLQDIAVGTVITFTDNEWNGTTFNTGEAIWIWTSTANLVAGTVVTLDGLAAGQTASSNYGTVAFLNESNRNIDAGNEVVYAYAGDTSAPEAFLAAFASDVFGGSFGSLDNTGLVEGATAISIKLLDSDGDVAAYNGARAGLSGFADYLASINDYHNWIAQDGNGDESVDGVVPDAPFVPAGFDIGDPNTQIVEFAAGSLDVSHNEGDGGETVFTFTVERSGPTTGAIDFTGTIAVAGTTYANDFSGGTVPASFSGTIADGEATAQVTVTVAGDTVYEQDNAFTLSFTNVHNDAGDTVLGQDIVATGTIVNDDAATVKIAFVGYNAENDDNIAFAAISDITAGTVINFTNKSWSGSSFVASNGSAAWSWTADGDIAAGTVITMDGINSASPTSNLGTIATSAVGDFGPDRGYIYYAYTGSMDEPSSFLTALLATTNQPSSDAWAEQVGLVPGVTAIVLAPGGNVAVGAYTGPRYGQSSIEDYLPIINNPANWAVESDDWLADDSADGVTPDLPFSTGAFTDDPAAQVVQFAAGSLSVSQVEGSDGGELAYTFTVERSNGTGGDLSFTAYVPEGNYSGGVNAADFGGTLPVIAGTIPDGQASTTVTVMVKRETLYEVDETFRLVLDSGSNSNGGTVVVGQNAIATGTIQNDDAMPGTIHAGETVTAPVFVDGANNHLIVEEGGSLIVTTWEIAVTWRGSDGDVVIDNAGLIANSDPARSVLESVDDTGGSLTINNLATGVIRGQFDLQDALPGAVLTLNNAGLIETQGRLDFRHTAETGTVIVNNLAGGVITQTANGGGSDVMRPGENTVVNNWGSIVGEPGHLGGGDAIDYQSGPGTVNNYAGGLIEGSRHAVTGDREVVVFNEAGATMIGRNGSAVNIDNDGTEAEKVFVTNYGTMEGRSGNLSDSDGDAIDTDGLAEIDNYGTIAGLGHNGYHDGEPNVSEGIAIGGGVINNYAGATIYGYGRAIQVDDSENGPAYAAMAIYNEGLIKGDGNIPTGVDPEDAAAYDPNGREAINIVGDFSDTLTNKGTIVGGVKMGGGGDTLDNSGSMAATGGSAIDLGEGDDTFTNQGVVTGNVLMGAGNDVVNLHTGSSIASYLDGGADTDTLNLLGDGEGTVGDLEGFEAVNLVEGAWTFLEEGANIAFQDGAQTLRIGADLLADGAFGGTISGFGLGDAIELKDVGLGTTAVLGANNVLTIAGGGLGGPIALQLDPTESFAGMAFVARSDGAGGTGIEVVDDAFMGGAGGDGFKGTNGNDVAFGNGGNDDMDAGGGDDYLDGGDGNDEIEGDGGNDVIAAGAGNDEVWGGSGNDVVDGGAGSDEMYGEAGDDELHGGDGDDEMEGGSGNDRMHGDAGNDEMYGDNGNDELHGGAGNDEMDGDRGNDIVIGEAGNDRLAGGDGDDIFVFGPGSGRDVVEDFDLGSDLIDVRGYGFASADEVLALVETAGRNTAVIVLDDSAGDMVTLLGIRANQLHAEDFLVA